MRLYLVLLILLGVFACKSKDKKITKDTVTGSQQFKPPTSASNPTEDTTKNSSIKFQNGNEHLEEKATDDEDEIYNSRKSDTLTYLKKLSSSAFPDYIFMDYRIGDINADHINDAVVVLQKDSTKELGRAIYARKTLLLLNTGFSTFKVASENNHIIECSLCGGAGVGDPYQGISISYPYIHFHSFYGACTKSIFTHTFKYTKKNSNWYLTKIVQEDYNCNPDKNGEIKTTVSIQTRKDFGTVTFNEYGKYLE